MGLGGVNWLFVLTAKTTERARKEKVGKERRCVHICTRVYTMRECVKCLHVYFPLLVQGVIGGRPGRAILELRGLSLTVVPYYLCEGTVCLQGFRQRSRATFHAQKHTLSVKASIYGRSERTLTAIKKNAVHFIFSSNRVSEVASNLRNVSGGLALQ